MVEKIMLFAKVIALAKQNLKGKVKVQITLLYGYGCFFTVD